MHRPGVHCLLVIKHSSIFFPSQGSVEGVFPIDNMNELTD